MENETNSHQEAVDTVKSLIKDIEVAMMTTISNGKAVSRPMQTQETEFDGDLWFLTMKDTAKYNEISTNPSVNLSYSGKSYVSITGTAEFSEDLERKKEYWSPIFDQMLETSYDDPNVVLIKVTPETAEYWETGNKVKMVKQFAKKLAGKESLDDETELNRRIKFDQPK